MQVELAEEIEEIVRSHTKLGSKHQIAALKLLASHCERFAAEIRAVTCSVCGEAVPDCVRWTEAGRVVDTWGYLEVDKDICFRCDGSEGSFIGDILMPPKKHLA